MSGDEWLAQLAGSPDFYPQKLDLIRECLLLIRFSEDAYRGASFLDDRVLGPATRGAWMTVERVAAAIRLGVDPRPLNFILHTGHVGSTLLSRLLDETGVVLSLREPLPLRTLAEAHDVVHEPESLLGQARFELLLDTLMQLWRRGYASTRCVVVKATSSAARLAPVLLDRYRDTRAIYLGLRAEPAIATLLAGQNSPVDLRGHGPGRMRRLAARIGTAPAALHSLSPGELAAMSWLVESLTRREALDRYPGRVIAVDFDAFLGDIAACMQRVLVHFDLPADAGQLSRMTTSPVLNRYSKAPELPYGPAMRSQVLGTARRDHRGEIAKGMDWLARLARSDDAVARVLAEGAD